ncbi:hypothetical protein CRUP_037445 [Coryphaenoides rupestris]|nr:hypothetical protein CRUP_037445 [Coryphaenoides rupestris]
MSSSSSSSSTSSSLAVMAVLGGPMNSHQHHVLLHHHHQHHQQRCGDSQMDGGVVPEEEADEEQEERPTAAGGGALASAATAAATAAAAHSAAGGGALPLVATAHHHHHHHQQRARRAVRKQRSYTLCEVCNIQLNSPAQAQIHYNGKSHQKRLKQISKGKMAAFSSSSSSSDLESQLTLGTHPGVYVGQERACGGNSEPSMSVLQFLPLSYFFLWALKPPLCPQTTPTLPSNHSHAALKPHPRPPH